MRVFEGPASAREVFEELRTIPFLGLAGRRVVVVERGDAFLQAHWPPLLRFLQKPSADGRLILCVGRLNPNSPPRGSGARGDAQADRAADWRTLMGLMASEGVVIDCARLTWQDAKAWVRTYAESLGGNVTPRGADALVEALGPNLPALRTEVDKLCTRAGTSAVTEREVEAMASQGRSRSAFDLAEAVARADAPAALQLCGRLMLQGESREAIVAVLALQLRRLWQIKRFRQAGLSEQEAGRRANTPAFAVRRALRVVGSLSEGRFARQIALLAEADAESKAASLRTQEEQVWLEGLLVRLCRA